MASPSMTTSHAAGNLANIATLTNASPQTFDVDYSTKFEGQIQISVTFGSVATTAGLQIDVFRRIGSGPAIDTLAVTTFVITATASTTQLKSLALPTGRYRVKLTNLDATNSVTSVTATDDTVDSVA